MNEIDATNLSDYFAKIPDKRIKRKQLYPLIEIFVIALCGIIAGAESWVEIVEYGYQKEAWLRSFLRLENGIPSHDTMNRVFNFVDPIVFGRCFLEWMQAELALSHEEVVAIDGKTLRRSHDSSDGKAAIHMVSALASESGLVLGQMKVAEKSNEITAIPKLLEVLEVKDCIITIDAMGCQKEIARKIGEKGANYVLALKGNQGNLHKDIGLFFEDAHAQDFKNIPVEYEKIIEKNRDRIEERRYWITNQVGWLKEMGHAWAGLKTIGMVESTRTLKGVTSREARYYIASILPDAKLFAHATRSHWAIENKLHWLLDVVFREDECRCRKGHGAENFAVLRHLALNLIKKNPYYTKKSVRCRRKIAAWNQDYLKELLFTR